MQRKRSSDRRCGQTGVESQAALAQLKRITDDLRAQVSQFETREERLRGRLNESE